MPSFRAVALTAALVCFGLTAAWLLIPQMVAPVWGIEASGAMMLLSRRSAALFLGFGVIMWLIRNEAPSRARRSVAIGFIVSCLALAALGVFEVVAGNAGPGILSAAVLEVILAAAFISTLRSERT